MSQESTCPVYERMATTDVADAGIRPGGLELTQRALAWCRFEPGAVILDVGCGTGFTLNHLTTSYKSVGTGIDASPVLLKRCRDRYPFIRVVRAVGEHLPFRGEYADGVLAECSLSVMADPYRALDEFRRVLKPDGTLILTDVYARNPEVRRSSNPIPADCCLNGATTREELMGRLTERGFRTVLWEDHSDHLKRFAVELILSYGSLNEFWRQTLAASGDPGEIQRSITQMRPGYFLLIARKRDGTTAKEDSR